MAVVIVGPGGSLGPIGSVTTVSAPTELVQILHDFPFTPAGVLCVETGGDIVEPARINHPQFGVVEVTFGFSFTGQIFLS